ncbi:MAG: hypothetical protein Q8P42_00365 [Gallionella sp.]|nr:hypothetical protein [Gallionella sp.]
MKQATHGHFDDGGKRTGFKLQDRPPMNTARYLKIFTLIPILAILNSGCGGDGGNTLKSGAPTENLSIGRMKVAIMPEYDDPSVLAIYDGKFEEVPTYPIKTSFLIPKGSVISDACSLSHEGQHFCQLYRTVNRGDHDEVSLLLPYPNFYLSFHTPRLDIETEKKEWTYLIKSNHPVKTLEVDIQQPLRSTDFNVTPPGSAIHSGTSDAISVIKGFNHFVYKFEGIAKGQENAFKIAYLKSDPNPSVDIKYTAMRTPQTQSAPYEAQRSIKTIIYAFFGAGVLCIAAVAFWFIRSRNKKRAKST